ncbi:MAG: fluoride exporter [Propionibacteriaceae bacterium]|nr:Camphor resistance CrcB protein [Propionibacteriaceae bacterium]MDX6321346.1 fluoride exporter [Propionibacteriaceae bacterium]
MRPVPTRPSADVGLVFIGGAAGTLSRYGLTLLTHDWSGVPVITCGINASGALLLGLLLEVLALGGPDRGRRRLLRLLLGTGFLGGFTTYSALAVDADVLIRDGRVLAASAYALGTLALGLVGAATGMLLARRLHATRSP